MEGRGSIQRTEHLVHGVQIDGAVTEEAEDETGRAGVHRVARAGPQPAELRRIRCLERLRLPHHHAHGDPDRRHNGLDQRRRWRQPAARQVADELNPPGAPLLGFASVLDCFRDNLQQHAGESTPCVERRDIVASNR